MTAPKAKDIILGANNSHQTLSSSKKPKTLIFVSSFATLLIVSAVIGIVAGLKNHNHNTISSSLHSVLKSSCSSTLYPDLCFSAVANSSTAKPFNTQKEVIEVSIRITSTAVGHNYFTVKKLLQNKTLTPREKVALHDCLETIDATLDELHEALGGLHEYSGKKSLSDHADDLKTLLSSAITNQETCIDGFSHGIADKVVRQSLYDGLVHVAKMCSNALAMIKDMTDKDIEAELKRGARAGRKLKQDDSNGWPEWLSAGDRKLLQSSTVTANAVVASDGSGNFNTIADAVAAAPENSNSRYVIRIKAGVYRENVEVGSNKRNIMFMGEGKTQTIITGNRNVVDGSTTFNSATVAVIGGGFLARDITFQNTAGPLKYQAVALRVGSDLSAFYNCDILGYQDTLYTHTNRQFYTKCLIAGTVDFIFGNAAAVFQDCDIHARRPASGQTNMVTAQGRTDPNQNTGIVIQKCRIGATSDLNSVEGNVPTYLGRPWQAYSRTVVMQSSISNVIRPEGWHEWVGDFALDTLFYAEYANTGAGAGTSNRVKWKGFKVLSSASEAIGFTAGRFIGGGSWLGSTGFPFTLGF